MKYAEIAPQTVHVVTGLPDPEQDGSPWAHTYTEFVRMSPLSEDYDEGLAYFGTPNDLEHDQTQPTDTTPKQVDNVSGLNHQEDRVYDTTVEVALDAVRAWDLAHPDADPSHPERVLLDAAVHEAIDAKITPVDLIPLMVARILRKTKEVKTNQTTKRVSLQQRMDRLSRRDTPVVDGLGGVALGDIEVVDIGVIEPTLQYDTHPSDSPSRQTAGGRHAAKRGRHARR